MKTIIAFILSFFLLSTSFSSAPGALAGIREAISELNYALTVEWDQKDASIRQQQIDRFHSRIAELELKGISRSTILKEAIQGLPKSKARTDMLSFLDQVDTDVFGPQDFQKVLSEIAEKSKTSGASWNGSIDIATLAPVLVIAGIVVVILLATSNKEEVKQTDGSTSGGSTSGGSTSGGSTSGGSTTGGGSSDQCCFHRGADGTCYHENPVCQGCECYHRGADGTCFHCSCGDGKCF